MSDPATAYAQQILSEDALAEAPVENEPKATPPVDVNDGRVVPPLTALGEEGAALPQEATGITDEEARLKEIGDRLKRTGGYNNTSLSAVFRAAKTFNDEAPDDRKVSELMLGLVWACEGHPRLELHLQDTHSGHLFYLVKHFEVVGSDAEAEGRRRAVKISAIGVWNCGLDDIFILRGSEQTDPDVYSWKKSLSRWRRNLNTYAGWTKDVPFEHATPGELTSVGVDFVLGFEADDAAGLLVATASRFTKRIWELPDGLAARGYPLNFPDITQLSEAEPVLAYATYQTSPLKAPAYFELGVFAREFCSAVADSAIISSKEIYLKPIIEVINRWLAKLKNESNSEAGLGWAVETLLLNDKGVTALQAVTRKSWDAIPAEELLSETERKLLERVQQTWVDYALYVNTYFGHKPPGEFLGRGSLDGSERKLIRTDNDYGFAIQNMAQRFVRVNPNAPLGTFG
ncbi:MAG TPA: hypothetical protein VGB73_20550 [Pyrinomonadaceae bacterium]|jgi:hypothetical protein